MFHTRTTKYLAIGAVATSVIIGATYFWRRLQGYTKINRLYESTLAHALGIALNDKSYECLTSSDLDELNAVMQKQSLLIAGKTPTLQMKTTFIRTFTRKLMQMLERHINEDGYIRLIHENLDRICNDLDETEKLFQ